MFGYIECCCVRPDVYRDCIPYRLQKTAEYKMAKGFHDKPFNNSTKLKLEIFGKCFRECLPLFIHNMYVKQVFVFDFFAGSVMDIENNLGRELILIRKGI